MLEFIKKTIKKRIEKYIESMFEKKIDEYSIIFTQLQEFHSTPPEMLYSHIIKKTTKSDMVDRFEKLGVKVRKEGICIDEFEAWLKQYPALVAYYENMEDVKIEKLLEHYLTTKYLDVDSNMVYIDVAACGSPFATILGKKFRGGRYYCQDLIFENGIHGNKIGSDAGSMPLEDNFVDVMALHCAFECFQGDSDIRFVKEASRVLKQKGKFGIIPLYISNEHFVTTGPKYDKRKVIVEPDVKWVWRDDRWDKEPFSRYYSPEAFKSRIIDNIYGMNLEIIYFTNLDELSNYYSGSSIYCNFLFRAFK